MAEHTVALTEANFDEVVSSATSPLLVDFWASWCGPCVKVAPILDEIAKENEGKLQIGKVNVDENPSLAMRYEVQSIPTMVLFKDGKPSSLRIVGAKGKDSILSELKGAGVLA